MLVAQCCYFVTQSIKKASNQLTKGFLWKFNRTQSRNRTGMEINPLVFETSASTYSAIWA